MDTPTREAVSVGNAFDDGAANRQWFIGPFLDPSAGPRRTDGVGVKWARHPRGERRADWAPAGNARTVSVLVRGRFAIEFREAEGTGVRRVVLEREGDYAIWTPAVEHTWEAEEESVVVTVRWPDGASP